MVVNLRSALVYAQFSRGTVRNSLGSPSLLMLVRWIESVFEALLGHGVGISIGLLGIASFRKAILRNEAILNPLQRSVVGVCACAGVPLVLAQLTSTNHLLRYLTPVIIPLAIAVGVLADSTGWTRHTTAMAFSSFLFCAQLGMIVYPVVFPNNQIVDMGLVNGGLPWRAMSRFDQWDWRPLRDIGQRCGIETPAISFLGAGRAFNPPAIAYPWIAAITSTRLKDLDLPPDPAWLWHYEDGPVDWQALMDAAGKSDIVLTVPGYLGEPRYKENLDNQHNDEFAERLSRDGRFQKPIRLEMGRFTPVEVLVFLNENLTCQSAQTIGGNLWNRPADRAPDLALLQ